MYCGPRELSRDNLVYNDENELTLNLNNNIKVFIKSNNSFMVKNFDNYNCIAVSSNLILSENRSFSLSREGIRVYQNENNSLNLKLVKHIPPVDNEYTACICYDDGRYKYIKHFPHHGSDMFKFKTCDQVFNHGNKKVTTDMKERISMLYNTCVLSQHLDGDVEFHFRNGIEVKQSRTGQTQITFLHGGTIKIDSAGKLNYEYHNVSIVSSDSDFYIEKATISLKGHDKIPSTITMDDICIVETPSPAV